MAKKGLGRGLGALIPEVDVEEQERGNILEVEVAKVRPNPKQPRKTFDQGKLEELAASIREHGIVQPIVVISRGGYFEIVAGERRWRAAQLAGLEKMPALVREFSDAEVMEIALIENLQREDLNPLEEAEAYRTLLDEFKLTQDQLAQRLGRSRPQITNTVRLLQLGEAARGALRAGRITMGHAKVLLAVEDPTEQSVLLARVVQGGMSVRQVEELVEQRGRAAGKVRRTEAPLSDDLAKIEEDLREYFGTPVKLSMGGEKGKIEITVFGEEGLQRILDALGVGGKPGGTPPREPFHI